jgi:hypothetical protein
MAHTLSFCLSLILTVTLIGRAPTVSDSPHPAQTPVTASDAWWDTGWPYRIRVDVAGSGVVSAAINFTTQFNALGLNHALLDLRSVRVVPYAGGTPGAPIPYAESYSAMLNDSAHRRPACASTTRETSRSVQSAQMSGLCESPMLG